MKRRLYKLYGFMHSLKYVKELSASISSIFDERILENREHIKMAADWLLYMQNSDGGYSRKFSFIRGRDISYIETTGYIIPTMIAVGKYLDNQKYIDSALKAGRWLLEIQNEDGSFNEIDTNKPFAFDTGQCLFGLIALYEYTHDQNYYESSFRAVEWLAQNQEDDGSWQRVAYHKQKHTYYTRVASAIYSFALISENEAFQNVALKNIDWLVKNQLSNGYFKYSAFSEGEDAYLHTLIYILEGVLDIYEYNGDQKLLDAILLNSEVFKNLNCNRDLILCSQYNQNFDCVNSERCMTGLAQWAGVALRIFEITGDEAYKHCAINTLFYLKAKQIKSSTMKGAFSASIPFWGRYGWFDFVNWTNKFFIDTMLIYEKLELTYLDEQERFVGSAFNMSSSVVTDSLSYMDLQYIEQLQNILPRDKKIKVLDVGCGRGVLIETLKKKYPNIDFYGIDPVFEGENIIKGSSYKIDFDDNSFDIVMSFEVLQHTYLEASLAEFYRVLKNDAKIIIAERNRYSILGVLKPFFECFGRWMYPFDSPFREKWYGVQEWRYYLGVSGFFIKNLVTIEGRGKPFFNRYLFIEGKKN